jgi:hypothetical protein
MRYTGIRNDQLISHESEEKGIALMTRWTLVPIREEFYKPL